VPRRLRSTKVWNVKNLDENMIGMKRSRSREGVEKRSRSREGVEQRRKALFALLDAWTSGPTLT
jgi:hypothetical protein